MRASVVCLALVCACDKPSDAPATRVAPAPEPPAVKPPEPAKPAEPAPPAIECAKLLTADDVKQACGATVEIGASSFEGKNPLCARTLTVPHKKSPAARFALSSFKDAAAAEDWVKLQKTAETEVLSGVGDFAWTRTKDGKDVKEYDVGARKGALVIKLSVTQNSANKKAPCTLAQLTELAKVVVARLP